MVQIRLSGISKSFGALKVLKGLDLAIEDRSYVCLLGPSGCGKTTLMRVISGLEQADAGTVHFDGTRVDGMTCAQRDVGLAFQNYALYPHLTVEGNLRFPLKAPMYKGRYSEAENVARIDEIAELLQIKPYLNRTIDQLSGGQQQRVSLGRALIRRPKVLLLDEPITHLDARLRYAMRSELKRVHEVMGTTTIHVTHDQQEALAMADQLVLMREGSIEQEGQAMDLHDDPCSSFVAGFLGDPPRSIFRVRVAESGGELVAILGGASFPLRGRLSSAAGKLVGRAVVLAVPARAIRFETEGAPLIGVVVAHEMIEGAQRIVFDVEGARLNAQSPEVRQVANGDRLGLSIDLSLARLFDAETGTRLARAAVERD